jgi:IMP dehydrogenase
LATGPFKEIRRVYGFEEVAIVPGDVTVNPDQTATELEIGSFRFKIPILASAMDAVASPSFSEQMHRAGGLGVMNLEGLQTRYDNPQESLDRIAEAPKEKATEVLQKAYSTPIREELVGKRVKEI